MIDTNNERENVEFYYNIFQIKNKRLEPFFMPYAYKDISNNIGKNIQNWFIFANNYQPTYDLFFSVFENPYIHPVYEFLSYVQALESYHDRKNSQAIVIPDIEFISLISEVEKILEEKIKNRETRHQFINRSKYWNTKSLRIRLKEIYENDKEIHDSFIPNKDEFISKTTDTRNYYTHYDIKLEKTIIPKKDLPLYSQSLKWILIIIFLKDMGFDPKILQKTIEKYRAYLSIDKII